MLRISLALDLCCPNCLGISFGLFGWAPQVADALRSEAPEKPFCPDLPTASPMITAAGVANETSTARAAAVTAGELKGAPISQDILEQARFSRSTTCPSCVCQTFCLAIQAAVEVLEVELCGTSRFAKSKRS